MTTIFYDDLPIAELADTVPLELTYAPAWLQRRSAFPVSLTMPLGDDHYPAEKVLPWLANLLPESHLSEIGQQLKISPQDVIGLLQHMGRDTAGALSIGTPRLSGNHVQWIATSAHLERMINGLPQRPFLIGDRRMSMSLAGVQDKLPVFIGPDGAVGIAVDGTPSTHILKPDIKRLSGSVQNEALCMVLAKACGLDVANVTTGRAGDRTYLLVERFDRLKDAAGQVRRIHQEDFCQLLGLFPNRKYQKVGIGGLSGPGLAELFAALNALVSPRERLPLLDAVIFNVLVCNSDSHAKNYAVLIGAGGSARLAPLYDVMCAKVYKNVDQNLPQAIAGKMIAEELHRADWLALAKDIGLNPASTLKRVEDLVAQVLAHVDAACLTVAEMEAGPHDILARAKKAISKRCTRILRQLKP
jgi:serine/threonine-protein kinase HipA